MGTEALAEIPVVVSHPPPLPPPLSPVTLLFTGDVMPSRYVAVKMATYGYDYPLSGMKDILSNADLTIINLESPVLHGAPVPNGSMVFRTDPEFLPALKRAGVDIVVLANNHSANLGEGALIETLRHLDDTDMTHLGAGTSSDAYAPIVRTVRGLRIAFVAQNDTDVVSSLTCASPDHVGTACYDLSRASSSIIAARQNADIVVFLMHSGTEYEHTANDRQRALAHAAIDAGADLVIGHHPHVVQAAEIYKGKRIYYSLGNFIFDQNWSLDTRLGLVVGVTIDPVAKMITDHTHTVIRIDDYSRPIPASGDDDVEIRKRLGL